MVYDKSRSASKKISLLYSGGCDSTLSASILAKDFEEIHLVTFKHYATWNVGRSRINVQKLRVENKQVRFIHVFLNISGLFYNIQKGFFNDRAMLPYFPLYICGACKLAMHTDLICYNLAHDITFASSGASHEMSMFPAQTEGGLSHLEKYYAEYGMQLMSPVYRKKNVDVEAIEKGLLEPRHLKKKHKASWNKLSDLYVPIKNVIDNTQGFCFWIAVVDIYIAREQKKSRLSRTQHASRVSKFSQQYYQKKIDDICRKYIELSQKKQKRKQINHTKFIV